MNCPREKEEGVTRVQERGQGQRRPLERDEYIAREG